MVVKAEKVTTFARRFDMLDVSCSIVQGMVERDFAVAFCKWYILTDTGT